MPSKRQSLGAQASEAQRLLDDPAFKRAFELVERGLIRELTELKHDGSADTDAYEREICRVLRTLSSVKRAISLAVQGQQLRLADFKPRAEE